LLIELDPHCHTTASGHAYSTITENAAEAQRKGLKLIAITDHTPEMPGGAPVLHFANLRALPKIIEGVEVLKGCELNILNANGEIDSAMTDDLLKELDVVIASLHPPCFPYATAEGHTNAVINTMENRFVNIIGHLGDSRYPFDIRKVISKAKETGVLIEINNASLNPSSFRFGGCEVEIAKICKELEVMVVMASDAHFSTIVGEMSEAEKLLAEIGMPERLVANTSVEMFKERLKRF